MIMTKNAEKHLDAALIVIGDELLTGSIADANGPLIARRLRELEMDLREVRVIGDDVAAIEHAVRSMHGERRWLFVVGGLGPTHDDLTAAGIAAAFDVPLALHQEALQALVEHHAPEDVPEGRIAAARLPEGCDVLPDKISGAAGFIVKNLIALPGDPTVTMHLFELVVAHLQGTIVLEASLKVSLLESDIAKELGALQAKHPVVRIGCYPYFGARAARLNLVLRSRSEADLRRCEAELRGLICSVLARRTSALHEEC